MRLLERFITLHVYNCYGYVLRVLITILSDLNVVLLFTLYML